MRYITARIEALFQQMQDSDSDSDGGHHSEADDPMLQRFQTMQLRLHFEVRDLEMTCCVRMVLNNCE